MRNLKHTIGTVIALVVAGAALVVAGLGLGPEGGTANAQDCNPNAIIQCGTGSASQFIATVRSNDSGNGHHDLQAIYAHYGLDTANYDKFVASARPGTAYKDGRIVVDGKVVATNAKSIGRLASYQGSGYFSVNISGQTYYGNTNDQAFASSSIPVMALFDAKGVLLFAVLTSCGNPTYGTNVVPSYSCNALHAQAVSGQANTYQFTTDASAANNATIVKLTYSFGDGTQQIITSNFSQAVRHTYAAPGSYAAKVEVTVSLPGNQTATTTAASCATTVTITAPPSPTPTPPAPTPPVTTASTTPTVLPNTGAGNVFGIVTGAAVVGTIGSSLVARRRIRSRI